MTTPFDELIQFFAGKYNLESRLVKSFCYVESNFQPYATRYELHWSYFEVSRDWGKLCGTTHDTEVVHQATSWGLLQTMGSVAREMGFALALPMLTLPEHGLDIGCKKLSLLYKKYNNSITDLAAAYNSGRTLKKANGSYVDQIYVDKIMGAYNDNAISG